jgi:hypothetical protein
VLNNYDEIRFFLVLSIYFIYDCLSLTYLAITIVPK